MCRRIVLWLAAVAVCGFLGTMACGAEQIDNPIYQNWAQFKPGSFATLKSATKMGDMSVESKITQTLKQVTDEKVIIEMEMVTLAAGQEMKMPARAMEHLAKIEKVEEEPAEAVEPVKLDEGAEELTVNDMKIKTKWVKTEFTQDDTTIVSTVWTSDDIPGQAVKMVSETKGPMTSTSETILVDFKAEKK